jgi:hypothetical protein
MLTEYYTTDTRRSSFGALVDVAFGGYVTTHDHDRAAIGRHEVGPNADKVFSREREAHGFMRSVGEDHEHTFAAWLGPYDWVHSIDQGYGSGDGQRVVQRFGEFVGVTLLTASAVRAFERHRERHQEEPKEVEHRLQRGGRLSVYCIPKDYKFEPKRRLGDPLRRQDCVGGYVVWLCTKATEKNGISIKERDRTVEDIREEVHTRARGALFALGSLVGEDPFTTSESKVRRTRERISVGHVERVRAPGGRWA